MPNPVISQITLPSGTTYDIKDAVARAALAGGMLAFIGAPDKLYSGDTGTTEVPKTGTGAFADGNTTVKRVVLSADVNIRGTSYNANDVYTIQNGDTMIVGNKEYVATVSSTTSGDVTTTSVSWHEFGDTTTLGALAYKDSGSVTFTPGGSVTTTMSGTSTEHATATADSSTPDYTPSGTVSQPTFSGSSMTSTGTFTPAGSVSLTTTNKTAPVSTATVDASNPSTYTPAGTVSAPTISVKTAGGTDTIHNPTKVTVAKTVAVAAPGAAAPSNNLTYYSVSDETLSLYQIGYTTGDSITTSDVTVKTGDAAYESSTPSFTGTAVRLVTGDIAVPTSASFAGTENQSVSVTGTPSGTVSQPTFTGSGVDITVTVPDASTLSSGFTGTEQTVNVTFS